MRRARLRPCPCHGAQLQRLLRDDKIGGECRRRAILGGRLLDDVLVVFRTLALIAVLIRLLFVVLAALVVLCFLVFFVLLVFFVALVTLLVRLVVVFGRRRFVAVLGQAFAGAEHRDGGSEKPDQRMLTQMAEITLTARELMEALAADELPRLHKHPRVEIRAGSRANPEVFPPNYRRGDCVRSELAGHGLGASI